MINKTIYILIIVQQIEYFYWIIVKNYGDDFICLVLNG